MTLSQRPVRSYQLNITQSSLDEDGVYQARVPTPDYASGEVVAVRVVAPELTGLTTGDSVCALVYSVGSPAVVVEAWAVNGPTKGAAIAFTPATSYPEGTEAVTRGDFRVPFAPDTPLYVRYTNSTDVELPSAVRVDIVVRLD